jgi:hypothetical protein
VVELMSRRNMLATATVAGGLLTAASVPAEQPRGFDPVSFTVVPPRRFEDLRVGDVFRPQAAHLQMHTPPPSKRFRLTIILSTTMWSMHDGMGILLPSCMAYRFSPSRLQVLRSFRNTSATFSSRLSVPHANSSRRCTLEIRSILHWKLSRLHRKETPA